MKSAFAIFIAFVLFYSCMGAPVENLDNKSQLVNLDMRKGKQFTKLDLQGTVFQSKNTGFFDYSDVSSLGISSPNIKTDQNQTYV